MLYYKNYYNDLTKNYPEIILSPHEEQINLDLERTYPQDPFFQNQNNLTKLKNILLAFTRRESTIGYCQGFNFIVGKILKICENEEETFWIFLELIEKILPINYYNDLSGLVTDSSIALSLIKQNFKEVYDLLESSNGIIYLNNMLNKWLLSIFLQGTSEIYHYFIWDLLLLEGNIVIFKTIYALMFKLQKYIFDCKTIDDVNVVFNKKPLEFNKREDLAYYLISKKFNFNMDLIKKYRKTLNPQIIDGIAKFGNYDNNNDDSDDENNSEKKNICDLDWPQCLKDKRNLIKEYDHIVLKELDEPEVIDNYFDKFFNDDNDININNINNINNKITSLDDEKIKYYKEERYKNLVIERRKHFCDSNTKSIRNYLNGNLDNNIIDKDLSDKIRRYSNGAYYFNKNKGIFEQNKKIDKLVEDISKDNQNIIAFKKENVDIGMMNT